jgi:hypothetical protein
MISLEIRKTIAMKLFLYLTALAVLIPHSLAAAKEPLSWQDAVGRLASERTRAETCVGLLKRHGDEAAISRGELVYGEAKAEVDAAIAGLIVTVAADGEPEALPDLERRLEKGVEGRLALCRAATALLPPAEGEKGSIFDVLGDVLSSLIEAAAAIHENYAEDGRLTRKTIQTQLEAARWPAFAAIGEAR